MKGWKVEEKGAGAWRGGWKVEEKGLEDGRDGGGIWERRKLEKLKRKDKIDGIRWEM